VEGPHLYKRDGVYYLIAAEGGTDTNHSVTAARSDAVTGPYVTDPRSPLLTHRHRGAEEPIRNVGHVDLVDTPDGETWAVALGVRPIDGTYTLGREVFLVPVTWSAHGPVFAPEAGGVQLSERLPSMASEQTTGGDATAVSRLHFDEPALGLVWNSLRGPVDDRVGPSTDGGGLELHLGPEPLSSTGVPAFIARRQQHIRFRVQTRISFVAAHPAEEVGLAVFQNQDHHATLALTVDESARAQAVLTVRAGGTSTRLASAPVNADEALLAVEADEDGYTFRLSDGTRWISLATIERSFFSTERAGGFVGVYLGLYGTSNGRDSQGRARIHWFEYQPNAEAAG
jgi:xylan 1,4-beta-xylosidase